MRALSSRHSVWIVVAALALAAGCDDGEETDGGVDAGVDAGRRDGGLLDAQVPRDAGDAATDGSARLDPASIPQFTTPLLIPAAMPPVATTSARTDYAIAVRQITQQVLPEGMPPTTVWAYGPRDDASLSQSPARTIEVRTGETVRITWINDLVDASGHFLPHLLPVDRTIHWANPPGPVDSDGTDPRPYRGPVPITTHVHGAHVPSVSDGLPDSWFLPAADDIPNGFATRGSHYGSIVDAPPGAAVFEYPNDRRASTLWYHDHVLGMTRLNVYTGLAGFFLRRDSIEESLDLPGPAPGIDDPPGTRYYEIPVAIQDRSFNKDGSLYYPPSRAAFDGFPGPYEPEGDVPPIWGPEFFGDVIVVNGHSWPVLEVEPRLYRFRFLNGCNSRFLILKTDRSGLVFHQIGTEGGLVADAPIVREQLLLAPGQRADVIMDFSSLAPGDEVMMLNVGPDGPLGQPGAFTPADPATTGRVMLLRVVEKTGQGNAGTIPTALPSIDALSTPLPPRDLTLNEVLHQPGDVPRELELGTAALGRLAWDAPVTEDPFEGDTEIWRLINLTMDTHPIHLHLVVFQVIDRTPFDVEGYLAAQQAHLEGTGPVPVVDEFFTGPAIPAEPWEQSWTDTAIARPGEVTRIIATFDMAGRYVWHCHILEHEDNEMMRPYVVQPR